MSRLQTHREEHIPTQRILIFGAGVIGSIYGGLLAKRGHDVTLLARGRRYEELKTNGLCLRQGQQGKEKVEVSVISTLNPDDIYDYILVAVRADQVEDALPNLAQNKSKNVVFMVNNARGYSHWEDAIGKGRVIPAFPGAGGTIEDGIVRYDITTRSVQPTTIGEIGKGRTPRLKTLLDILSRAGFPTEISNKMDAWQKTHLALVCPLALGFYYDGGDNYSLASNKPALMQVSKALKETFGFIRKSGIGITPGKFRYVGLVPLPLLAYMLSKIFATPWAETFMYHHSIKAKGEMLFLSRELIALAETRGFALQELKKLLDRS